MGREDFRGRRRFEPLLDRDWERKKKKKKSSVTSGPEGGVAVRDVQSAVKKKSPKFFPRKGKGR